jgi:hypothetical protein
MKNKLEGSFGLCSLLLTFPLFARFQELVSASSIFSPARVFPLSVCSLCYGEGREYMRWSRVEMIRFTAAKRFVMFFFPI